MVTLLLVIGILFFVSGIAMYSGFYKSWWLNKSTPVTPTGIAYGLLPASVIFFVMAYIGYFQPSSDLRDNLLYFLGMPSILLSIIFATIQPHWLKPQWLQWIETNHEQFLRLLWEDARKRGRWEWERQVRTQRGLEEWVKEVRHKYKLDHPDQRFIGDSHAK